MFVVIKFGNNESLLVNPSCAVINLLTSIKRRAGFGGTNKTIDLSDENGLVKDLDVHKFENATKFLQSHETYILVQKELQNEDGSSPLSSTTQYTYIPLLERYAELFPNFRIHVAEIPDSQRKKRVRTGQKSPSPAGKLMGRGTKKQEPPPRKSNRKK
ncbi:uncharacterized protein CXorf65 homolog [Aplysia californica]|uniref:Uncharacterized protein CXorf65 homolog n=1 Tax=Aplysia californica TaxID=6500 RepID=A0ABM0KAW1_APLCA|nr:uncharacterized protein CXorf65 homolog [Aplysia californica]XP_005113172.1 uncharacterized protein CXorf65 homolog [Aplysia californica]